MTPPARERRPGWLILAGLLLTIVLVWSFAPQLDLQRLPVVAGLVGPRNALTLLLAAGGAVLLVLTVAVRPARRALAPLSAALLIGAASSTPVMITRGYSNDVAASSARSIRVLSWNINGDLVSPATVAALAARERADIVVLPEIRAAATGAQYAPSFAAAGLPARVYPAITADESETVVLVRTSLGRYSAGVGHSDVPEKSAVLTPVTARLPRIVALHAAHPELRDNAQWQQDLRWVQQQCQDRNTIAVGDFNATLDGLGSDSLGSCADAAASRHAASTGTWPTRVPAWVGMPLDHVLAGADWTTRSFTVITSEDTSGARHRPILAVLSRAR